MKLDLKKLGALCTLLGAISFMSCLGSDDEVSAPKDYSFVMIHNMSPDSNGLRFHTNNQPINQSNLNYSQFIDYLNFESGEHNLTVSSGNDVLDTLSTEFVKNKFYSVFAINEFSNLELAIYADNYITTSQGNSLMRFIQLSPDSPVELTATMDGLGLIGIFNYKQATQFFEIEEFGNKKIYLLNETGDTLLNKEIVFSPGKAYTILSKGFVNSENPNQKLDVQVVSIDL